MDANSEKFQFCGGGASIIKNKKHYKELRGMSVLP